ncbi:hypothetical protein [Halobellus sp. GM3]|uniref:hypothetical protein n=1 Tax=Halobellus sp. GM3 TaxID=3458410 RepID=UPI00403DB3A6
MCSREPSTAEFSTDSTSVTDGTSSDDRSGDAPTEPVPMPRGMPPQRDAPPDDGDGVGSWFDSTVRRAGRILHENYPQLERQLLFCRSVYADAYVRGARLRYNRRHPAPIDPYRVSWVDPDRIVRISEPSNRSRFRRVGVVADGDWDRYGLRFRDTDVFCAFQRRFEDGVDWEETAFFRRITAEIERGNERWGCASPSAFRRRCDHLDQLYETIREHGFLSQRALLESGVKDPIERRRATVAAHVINDEIAVDVGRDGELLFADGRNRLAIAKLLDVEAIPVLVFRRHSRWVALRDAAAAFVDHGGTLPARLRRHPDIASFLEATT